LLYLFEDFVLDTDRRELGRGPAVRRMFPFRRPEDIARFEEGLRKAGLPE